MTPNFTEDHVSQIPAIQMLINMGYTYINPTQANELRHQKKSTVLLEDIVKTQLAKINSIQYRGKHHPFSAKNIEKAFLALKELPIQDGLFKANAAFYDLITLGKSFEQTIEGDKKSYDIRYIDWEKPENNVFHVTEEFSVLRTGRTDTYRPDLVLFINGIPSVIIECKSPAVSNTKTPTELAIEQHIRNFSKKGIRSLYMYSSLLISLAVDDGSYATTGTGKEFWSKWKERFPNSSAETAYEQALFALKNKPLSAETKKDLFQDRFNYVQQYFEGLEETERIVTPQDKLVYNLCEPNRLIDLIRNFTLYDNGTKKIARYQQYFAVKETISRIQKPGKNGQRTGGVIWATQGSGKSLTMVMLAQLIVMNSKITNPKIILVTDRVDLDDQISKTFQKCGKEVIQSTTGAHLTALLESDSDEIITTVINKFKAAVTQINQPLKSSEIFVLIDEGHRTQYGSFSVDMQRIFPNACFIAFTGTPLMRKEKSTAKKFGGYIGEPYTVKNAVDDGAVVPLLYEGRHNLMTLNEDPINRYFDKVSEPLPDYGKAALKRKFNTIDQLNKADQVILARAWDISEHYRQFFQTHEDRYKPKAQLVAPSIKAALYYHECLKDIGQVSSAVVVSRSDQREGVEDGFYNTNPEKRREDEYFEAMEDKYGNLKLYEKSIISEFKTQDHPEILIVVAKLLTGFDAPSNTVLYLCKSIKEHTLLQAIARVNRVYPGKDYGYIIDYYGNLEALDDALETYSGDLVFDPKDMEGLFKKITEETAQLPIAHKNVWDIFYELKHKKTEITAFQELLRPDDVRFKFYEKLSLFARFLKLALSSVDFVNNTPEAKITNYKKDAAFFLKLRVSVKRIYNDELSYAEFEPKIQKLINQHISTEGEVLKITDLVDIFNKEEREAEVEKIIGKAAKADHIASRTIKATTAKMREDPVYYKKLSELIKETIEDYLQKRIDESEYLKRVKEHEANFLSGQRNDVPESLMNEPVAVTFYNQSIAILNDENTPDQIHEEIALETDKIVASFIYIGEQKIVEWQLNKDISDKINIALGDFLYETYKKYDLDPNWDKIDALVKEFIKLAVIHY